MGNSLKDYGYSWNGMKEVSKRKAIELFQNREEVYLLYQDDTEGAANSVEEINKHADCGGRFGVERTSND